MHSLRGLFGIFLIICFHCMGGKKQWIYYLTSHVVFHRRKKNSYGHRTTWGWVHDNFIFGWPARKSLVSSPVIFQSIKPGSIIIHRWIQHWTLWLIPYLMTNLYHNQKQLRFLSSLSPYQHVFFDSWDEWSTSLLSDVQYIHLTNQRMRVEWKSK